MDWAVPPHGYSQREAMQFSLDAHRKLFIPEFVIPFHNPGEVAEYLNRMDLREKAIDPATVRMWWREFDFPATKVVKPYFFTTNLHVFSWLWNVSRFPVRGLRS